MKQATNSKENMELELICKALANHRRIAILRFLKQKPKSVGDVADAISLSIKSTSKHLHILANARILQSTQSGLMVKYRTVPSVHPIVNTLITIL